MTKFKPLVAKGAEKEDNRAQNKPDQKAKVSTIYKTSVIGRTSKLPSKTGTQRTAIKD